MGNFKKKKFFSDGNKYEFINRNFKLTYYKDPYHYIVIEDFLLKEFYQNIEKKFPSEIDFKKSKNKINRMNYDTSFKDKNCMTN